LPIFVIKLDLNFLQLSIYYHILKLTCPLTQQSCRSARQLCHGVNYCVIVPVNDSTVFQPGYSPIFSLTADFLSWNNGKKTALFASFAKEPFFGFLRIARDYCPSYFIHMTCWGPILLLSCRRQSIGVQLLK
jgi:hypothetical protein